MLTLEHLSELLEAGRNAVRARVNEFSIGGKHLAFNSRPAIMGVVNLSPDSWYRESVCLTVEAAVRRARVLSSQGADLIDIGAESTLGNALRIDESGQKTKLLPVITELTHSGIPLSVETYDAKVARACLEAGVDVLNLTGNKEAEEIYQIVADHDAAVIICYVQGENVREVGNFDFAADPVAAMSDYFARQIDFATQRGVRKILIDPGLGFYYRNLQDSAVRVKHQIGVFLNTFRLRSLGQPICHALPHAFEHFGEEVRCAEPFFAVLALLGKTNMLRTHEVPRIRAVVETMNAY